MTANDKRLRTIENAGGFSMSKQVLVVIPVEERHKEYLKRELAPTIEMFNTPDKEDKTPENALDAEENENLDLPELY